MQFPGLTLLLPVIITVVIPVANAGEPAAAPEDEGFFGKLAGAVKKGVTDGVDNGVQSAGPVKVLGYTLQYSKLKRANLPAYCLANADTGKLITVAPMFGKPYQRVDGKTGFAVMEQPADKYHNKVEVNLTGTLPGLTCADLIAKKELTPYGGPGATATQESSGPQKIVGCVGFFLAKKPSEPNHYALCHDRASEPQFRVAVETGEREPLRPGDKYTTGVIRTIKIDMASWNEYNEFVLHKRVEK